MWAWLKLCVMKDEVREGRDQITNRLEWPAWDLSLYPVGLGEPMNN